MAIENTMVTTIEDMLAKVQKREEEIQHLEAQLETVRRYACERIDDLENKISDRDKLIGEFRKGNDPTVADVYIHDPFEGGRETLRDVFNLDGLPDGGVHSIGRMAFLPTIWAVKIGKDIHEFDTEDAAQNFLLNLKGGAE